MLIQRQKRLMAWAGIVMTSYLIIHMLVNLSFLSEANFTALYTWFNAGLIRWIVLLLIVVALTTHVLVAIKIRQVNAKARIIDYAQRDHFTIPKLWVTASILFLLAFIIIHSIQMLNMESDKIYQQVDHLFQSIWMVLFYLAGLFILTLHLQHSLANVLQTLGKTSKVYHGVVWLAVLTLTGGFALIPLYSYATLS